MTDWIDQDVAPEWTKEVFECAEIRAGGRIVRPASGTITAAPVREEGGAVLDALDEALTYIEQLGANIERNDLDMYLDAIERPFSFAQAMRSRFTSLCVAISTRGGSPTEDEKLRALLKRAGEYLSSISSSWGRSRQASVLPLMRDIREALATREEAPADHVSDARQMVEAPAEAVEPVPEDDELPGDFLARVGMDGKLWADEFRKMALRLGYSDMDEGWLLGWFCNAVMAGYDHALRAQPQAREEAQPAAWQFRLSAKATAPFPPPDHWQYGAEPIRGATPGYYEVQPLYTTPPAPEAKKLRIAVEALEPFANLGVSSGPDDEPCHYAYRITRGAIRNARQALAALKAEV